MAPPPEPAFDLGAICDRTASATADGAVRSAEFLDCGGHRSDRCDYRVEFQQGQCYWVVGCGLPGGIKGLSLYLWDPDGRRITETKDKNPNPIIAHCPTTNGIYKIQAKISGGNGIVKVGIYSKTAPPPSLVIAPPPPPPPAPMTPWFHDGAGWALSSIGAAALIVGTGILAAEHTGPDTIDGGPFVGMIPVDHTTGNTVGSVFLVAGAALAVGGIIRFVIHNNRYQSEQKAHEANPTGDATRPPAPATTTSWNPPGTIVTF